MMTNVKTSVLIVISAAVLSSCNKELYQKKYEAASKTSEAADDLLNATSALNEEVNQKVEENPNSATRDFVYVIEEKEWEINRIKAETEDIKNKRIFNTQAQFDKLNEFQQRLSTLNNELQVINKSLDQGLDKTIYADVSFATGSYTLTTKGKQELERFIFNDIQAAIDKWDQEKLYKGKSKKLRITVAGYADLQGTKDVDRRKEFNLNLSEQRAKEVEQYLLKYAKDLPQYQNLNIDVTSEGKGETPPPGIKDLEKINNPERRICMISSYVIPEFK